MHAHQESLQAALWHALASDDINGIKEAINCGADVSEASKFGIAPLDYVMQDGLIDMARVLVAAKADLHKPNAHGVTPWDYAIGFGYTESDFFEVVPEILEANEAAHVFLKEPVVFEDLTSIKMPCPDFPEYICSLHADQGDQIWYVNDNLGMSYIYNNLIKAITQGTELEGFAHDIRLVLSGSGELQSATKYLQNFVPFDNDSSSISQMALLDGFDKGTISPVGAAMESAIAQFLRIRDRHSYNHGWLIFGDKAINMTIDLDRSSLDEDMTKARRGERCYYAENPTEEAWVEQGKASFFEKRGYLGFYNNVKEYPLSVVAHIAHVDIDHLCSILSHAMSDLEAIGFEGGPVTKTMPLNEWADLMMQNLKDIHEQWNHYYQIRLAEEKLQDTRAVQDFIRGNADLKNWSPYDINCNYLKEYDLRELSLI